MLVGGSALYTRAILDRFEFPGTDPDVRARLEEELARSGPRRCTRGWPSVDPAAAAQVLPSNGRRVVRALEVIEITGRPFSASLPEQRYHYDDAVQIGVDIDRETLDARIEQRVQQMWEAGFVDEVRRLAERGLREGRTANRALGYQQVLAFLDGELTEEEAQGADRHRHPSVRPPAGQLVPQGPADHLGAVRRPGSASRRRSRPSDGSVSRSSSRGRSRIRISGESSTGSAARITPTASIQNTERSPTGGR